MLRWVFRTKTSHKEWGNKEMALEFRWRNNLYRGGTKSQTIVLTWQNPQRVWEVFTTTYCHSTIVDKLRSLKQPCICCCKPQGMVLYKNMKVLMLTYYRESAAGEMKYQSWINLGGGKCSFLAWICFETAM